MLKNGFRLEQVLNYRREVEKVRTQEFARARRDFEGACERLKSEEQSVTHLNTECLDRQREGISATELQLYSDFFRRKSADIRQQRQEADSLDKRMAEKQDVLAEAAKEKKALETLKEKKVLSHKRAIDDKERFFLEEIALRRNGDRR
jgi:flagellar FliJ protein